ncbi:YadA-like family protein [Dyella sp. LX-66]|uniref:YadA-like family protein n=1 Tax=unclassified Dyella TaxID=2634549 RepID=UPI001BE0907F|nr:MULTISPECIES: YadA-like family protein [unclassified Dyella]MBT2116958.1 YadA-like family protein [Dyella sp. LX-1]MBT2138861.1 YadA-like family protein [Dyella sp. LX-66]
MSHRHPTHLNQHSTTCVHAIPHANRVAARRRNKGSELLAFGFCALALCVAPQAAANVLEICNGKTATIINAGSTAKIGTCNAQGKNDTTFLLASNGDGAAVHGHDNGTLTLRGNNGIQIHGQTSLNGNRLTSLAAGIADADAVNVGQLRPLQNSLQQANDTLGALEKSVGTANSSIASLSTGLDGANKHIAGLKSGLDTSNGNLAKLSGNLDTASSHLARLKSGLDSASSSISRIDNDLSASKASITHLLGALGGGATVDAAGNVVQPTYTIQGRDRTGVDGALNALDAGLDTANAQIARLDSGLGNGSAGLLRQAAPGGDITLAKDLDGKRLNIAGSFDEPIAGGGTAKKIKDRRLTGLAAGSADNDAVNLGQLKDSGLFDRDGTARHAVIYDGADKAMVSFGGSGGTVLANVAPGLIAAGSTQAVNGGQLHTLREDLQGQLHGLDGRVGQLETSGAGHHDDMSRTANDTATTAQAKSQNDNANHRAETGTASHTVADRGHTASANPATQPRQIAHVAPGTARTDAANWGQVQDAIGDVRHWTRRRFAQMDRRIAGMGAMGASMAQMAFSAQGLAKTNRVAVGVGRQGSRSAVALGYSHQLHANLNLSLGGAASGDDASMGAGLALGW